MKLSLEPVTRDGCELARRWRNEVLGTLRTPFPLTAEQQEAFYQSLQDRNCLHRYWEVGKEFRVNERPLYDMVGLVGLTNIDWYNGCAEISLIISPNHRGKGIGKEAVRLVLEQAFMYMRMHQVYGEVYFSNPGIDFWRKVVKEYGGYSTTLPDRKWWDGKWWDSLYFAIKADHFPKT